MTAPFDQSRYQVRMDWGASGLERVVASDVVVIIDVLGFSTAVVRRVAAGETVPLDAEAHAASLNAAPAAARAAGTGAVVLLGALINAAAVADAVLAEQHRRAGRTSVLVLPAGKLASPEPGAAVRFAMEDLLGAGAVIDALGARGIDHTSPEAAAAGEAFRGLRPALRHLLTASGSGQELIDRGARAEVLEASVVDAAASVPLLRDGVFVPHT